MTCGGLCACGSCGTSCTCGTCPDLEKSTSVTVVEGVAPLNKNMEGSEGNEGGNGCKCGSSCSCDPCTC
uniref:Metallothionein-like protein n=1 Tax=Salvia miltiorrhiza TaxID=226208 RepID=G4Y3P2_SALMI|nr:metallothionein [Salvia miltiorrhiza]